MESLGRLTLFVAILCIAVFGLAASAHSADCPEPVGWLPYGEAHAVAVFEGFAIFGRGTALVVADVSNPASPQQVGAVVLPVAMHDRLWDIAVSGGYAYVAADESGLRVIDISTPSSPVEVGSVDAIGDAIGVAVSGNHAYVATSTGLRVIDVSTPALPFEVGSVGIPGRALGVAVSGGYAYVAQSSYPSANDSGLHVIDVSTPESPIEVGFVDITGSPGVAWRVSVSGGHAYVAGWVEGLRVIDVSTPESPIEVGFVDGVAFDVTVSGGYAYVAALEDGLRVVDVSTPANPIEVGFYVPRGEVVNIAAFGDSIYAAAGRAGLEIFSPLSCPGYVPTQPVPRRGSGRRTP